MGQVLALKEDQMRKLILLTAAAAMAIPMSAPVKADPPGRSTPAQAMAYCQANFPDAPLGECVSFQLSSDTGFLTHYCLYLEGSGQLDELGLTFSDCVVLFRQN